jgi:hypothetical protein
MLLNQFRTKVALAERSISALKVSWKSVVSRPLDITIALVSPAACAFFSA